MGVDQARNLVYFMGTAASPLERHLYSSSLAPAEQPPLPPVQVPPAYGSACFFSRCFAVRPP